MDPRDLYDRRKPDAPQDPEQGSLAWRERYWLPSWLRGTTREDETPRKKWTPPLIAPRSSDDSKRPTPPDTTS